MSKNNKDKGSSDKTLKDKFQTGGGKTLEGLGADVQQEAVEAVNTSERKFEPYEQIKAKLADKEVQRRADLMEKALFEEYVSLRDKLEKIKPDTNPIYGEDDKVIRPAGYSKEKFDEKSNLLKRFDELKKAIEEARKDGKYESLDKYASKYKL